MYRWSFDYLFNPKFRILENYPAANKDFAGAHNKWVTEVCGKKRKFKITNQIKKHWWTTIPSCAS